MTLALRRALRSRTLAPWVCFAVVAWLVLYPVGYYAYATVLSGAPGQPGAELTLRNYVDALSNARTYSTLWTTLVINVACTTIGVALGLLLAWLVVRTDIPYRPVVALVGVIPFSMPNLLIAIGWSMLGSERSGLVNVLWRGLSGSSTALINIESHAGIIFVLSMTIASFAYLLFLGPLQNLDPVLEDSSRMSGASPWYTLRRVTLPLLAPALISVAALVFIRVLAVFETPLILGNPARIYVFSNEIYFQIIQSPPRYGYALVLGMVIVVITAVIVWLQYRHTGRRSFAVVTGRGYQPRRLRLGRWRPLALSVVALYALLSVVLPIGQLIVSSLMPVFGRYALDAFTVRNYQVMLDDPIFLRTLGNTFVLAIGGGLLCMVLSTLVAYVVVRTRFRFRAALDFIAWMPWAIPGLVLSLAMLWAYVRVPGPFGYGTLGVLVLASVTMGLPLGVQAVAATLRQLSPELEEAARVHRGSWVQAFGRIVFPLIRPSFIAGWFLLIFTFSRELAAVVLLYTPGTETLSIFILSHWAAGRGGVVAATAVVLIATLIALVLLEQGVLRALGAERRRSDAPAVGPPALVVTEAS